MLQELNLTLSRLKLNAEPLFMQIGSGFDVASAMKKPLVASRVAYIVPLAEDPITSEREQGTPIQDMSETYGVVIGLRATGNEEIDFKTLQDVRLILRNALFGKKLHDEYEPFLLGASNVMKLSEGQIFWMDRFITERTIEGQS